MTPCLLVRRWTSTGPPRCCATGAGRSVSCMGDVALGSGPLSEACGIRLEDAPVLMLRPVSRRTPGSPRIRPVLT
jgi:hypothetical protein